MSPSLPSLKPLKRIAVIGAGAAGITQTKQLVDAFADASSEFELDLVVFEVRDDVGGVWSVPYAWQS